MTDGVTGQSTKRLIATYLRMQLDSSEMLTGAFYDKSGWNKTDKGMTFICGDSVVPECAAPPPYLLAERVKHIHLADNGLSASEATETLLQLLMKHPYTHLPVWAFTLFATLRSVLKSNGLPTTIVLYVMATQGFGKTELIKSLCALYDESGRKLCDVYDAKSTSAAMRDALTEARDRVVLFDDVCKSTSRSKQRERQDTAADLTRAAANETNVVKKKGQSTVEEECAASLAITGEIPMETASDVTRCLTVEISEPLTDNLDGIRTAAAAALKGYITWFSQNYDMECEQLRRDYETFRQGNKSSDLMRVRTSHFELKWLLQSFLRFAKAVGAINDNAAMQIVEAANKALDEIWANTKAMVEKIEKKPPLLSEVIYEGADKNQFPCFVHVGCLCVKLHDLTSYLSKIYMRSDLSENQVSATLKENKMLSMDKSGDPTKKVRGKRHLCIPLSKLGIKF